MMVFEESSQEAAMAAMLCQLFATWQVHGALRRHDSDSVEIP